MIHRRFTNLGAVLLAAALLPWAAGCGGDDHAEGPAPADAHAAAEGGHGDAGHGDAGHGDAGGDPSQTVTHANPDSHAAHGDAAHGDATHGDATHGDATHGDATHGATRPGAGHSPAAAGTLPPRIKIKGENGETVASVKWMDDGAKLVDGDEAELARYTFKDGKLKIKDPSDKVLGYLVISGSGGIKVEDAAQQHELFKLSRQSDGDWKLEDGAEKLLRKIKRRDYGFEIEDGQENSLYKVKLKDGKTSLRNASDTTVMYTKTPVDTAAFACLGLEVVEDLRIRAGLLVQVASGPTREHGNQHGHAEAEHGEDGK